MVIDDSLLETAEQVLANWKELNHDAKYRSRSGTEVTKLIIGELTPRLITALRKAQAELHQVRELAVNYKVHADSSPEPRAQWSDIHADLLRIIGNND